VIHPGVATLDRWRALGRDLNAALDDRMYRKLIGAWSARSRHYHSLSHLEACLREFDAFRSCASQPGEVEMALWFHDAVYRTYSNRNEARSAEWAMEYLAERGVQSASVNRIRDYILATQHAAGDLVGDAALVVDIDLSILGQSFELYEAFERNVRKEYWWVSKRRYARGRTAVLQSFLSRPVIYATAALRERYEATARTNLRWAIDRLSGA
jgi:predicted metal-dependent HD superfamily phosphohydrolase